MKKEFRWTLGFSLIMLVFCVELLPGFVDSVGGDVPIEPPRTSTGLKELVEDLMDATTDTSDTDGDGLPDSVEAVIGTDFDNNDTDSDLLDDMSEIENDSDPLNPDSNGDGFPDNLEMNATNMDVDNDNQTNIWDFDNDGDGVNDEVDLCPFVKSTYNEHVHFSITMEGKPTKITLQLKPARAENLRLFYQAWDWPLDSEGLMKDLDNSTEDVIIVPQLNVTLNDCPDPSEVGEYGILVNEEKGEMYVPLVPVWDKGDIVAFTGSVFYNASSPMTLKMNASLIWRVMGTTDEKGIGLRACTNQLYVSAASSGVLAANASDIGVNQTFRLINLGDNNYALKALKGLCLSVASDKSIVLGGSEIGENEIFVLIEKGNGKKAFKTSNGDYLSVAPDGALIATSEGNGEIFELVSSKHVVTETTILATYNEAFMLTGWNVEQELGSSIATYWSPDKAQMVRANLFLNYVFLWNSTNSIQQIPSILAQEPYNLTVSHLYCSFSNNEDAFTYLSNTMLPEVLDSCNSKIKIIGDVNGDDSVDGGDQIKVGNALWSDPGDPNYNPNADANWDGNIDGGDQITVGNHLWETRAHTVFPVVVAYEGNITSVEMSNPTADSYLVSHSSADPFPLGHSYNVDLTAEPTVTTRMTKNNFYNTTSGEALDMEGIFYELLGWNMSANATLSLLKLMMIWNDGEEAVTRIGERIMNYTITPHEEVALWWNYSWAAPRSLDFFLSLIDGGRALKVYKWNTRVIRYIEAFKGDAFLREEIGFYKQFYRGYKGWKNMHANIKGAKSIFAGKKIYTSLKWIGRFLFWGSIALDIGITIYQAVLIATQLEGKFGADIGAQYAIYGVLITAVYAGLLFALGMIPYVGWAIGLLIVLIDVIVGQLLFGMPLIEKLLEAVLEALLYQYDLITVDGDFNFACMPSIEVTDEDQNGFDVGDRINVTIGLETKVNVHVNDPKLDFTDHFELEDCWHRPYIGIAVPPGSNSSWGSTGIPDKRDTETQETWRKEVYNCSAWIEPGIGMPNFPVQLRIYTYYSYYRVYEHYWFGVIPCKHTDGGATPYKDTSSSHLGTLYYDILPGSINDFATWRGITPLDYDGDGLLDQNETRSDRLKYDTDGDGLNDRYEVEQGTDPRKHDTDKDGLNDWFELTYGTNATEEDTDGDGLQDYLEVAGWPIDFTYSRANDPTEKFRAHVYSDPKVPDTDGDGVSDELEYWNQLNPNSKDTNGDGKLDIATQAKPTIQLEFAEAKKLPVSHWAEKYYSIIDIEVDAEGNIYVLAREQWGGTVLYVFDQNLGLRAQAGIFLGSWISKASAHPHIAIDEKNKCVHLISPVYPLSYVSSPSRAHWRVGENQISCIITIPIAELLKYSGDKPYNLVLDKTHVWGEMTANHTVPSLDEYDLSLRDPYYGFHSLELDVDSEGKIYALRRGFVTLNYTDPIDNQTYTDPLGATEVAWIDVYEYNASENSGTLIKSWGSYGTKNYSWTPDVPPPSQYGYAYPGEWRHTYDFNFTQFNDVNDVAVSDRNGHVYVADNGTFERTYMRAREWPVWPWDPLGFQWYRRVLAQTFQVWTLINQTRLREDRVAIYSAEGGYLPPIDIFEDENLTVEFNNTQGIEIDANGNLYVADTGNGRIHRFDPNGQPMCSWEPYFPGDGGWEPARNIIPTSVAVDSQGYVYVTDGSVYLFKFSQKKEEKILVHLSPMGDFDDDGLLNGEENGWSSTFTNATGTFTRNVTSDPLLKDTDFDGLTDKLEKELEIDPRDPDTDDDGLSDYIEVKRLSPSTDPKLYDTDGDGLGDGVEITFESDPTKKDSDGDGLSDFEEFQLNSKPNDEDTDDDGLSDYEEKIFNSSLTSPDSDGDFMFDSFENKSQTNPQKSDTDDDGLPDGHEIILNTDPLNNDTDGDNLTDGAEVDLWLNPTSNDTDNDGLSDSTELDWGTNPLNRDTDWDGIPDNEDPDSNAPHVKNIVLAFDADDVTSTFADDLARYTNVTVTSSEELLANYADAPAIVLVGRPDANGTVGKLIHDILLDSGDVLTRMMESDGNRLAVRYGIWNETQTVVMLSHSHPLDYVMVLDILRSKNITILPDSTIINYVASLAVKYPAGGSLNHSELSYNYLETEEIDTVKATDSIIRALLKEVENPTVEIQRYNRSTTPHVLTRESGLGEYELAVGKYVNMTISSGGSETGDVVESALIQLYYKESDLDTNENGYIGDPEDLNETSLSIYCFNENTGFWTKLSKDLDWVTDVGVNTADINLYGETYAGYVWAHISHLSFYGLAGLPLNRPPNVTEAYPSIEYLWPPNHKFINVTIEGVTDPDGDNVSIAIIDITSNEPPSGKHEPDAYDVGTDVATLRAERLGIGNGRVYVITFIATDGRGGETIGSVTVYVSHDMRAHALTLPWPLTRSK